MKKIYLQPTINVENAMPANLLCESFKGDDSTGLTDGGASGDAAHAPEWDLWGEDE